MTKRKERNHTPTFRAKVAMSPMRGEKTVAELAQQSDARPNQIAD